MRSFRPRSKAWPQPLAEDRLAARAERAMTSSDDSIYERHLGRNAANHAALTPLGFLARTAAVFPNRVSAIHGARRYTWAETYARRSEEHTSELQSLMRNSYAVFCLKQKNTRATRA